MESDPMTEAQGDRIIDLLKKILDELEEIKDNTSVLPSQQTDLERVARDVSDIAAR